MTREYWTAARSWPDPLGHIDSQAREPDPETRRKQRQRNEAERVHWEAGRTDGVIEEGETVKLADLLGIERRTEDSVPETIDGRTVQALFNVVPAAEPELTAEEQFARAARDDKVSKAADAVRHVRDRLREIEARKSS